MSELHNSVMVGVTGRSENTMALHYALSEARRLQCGVTVVHAVHPFLPPRPAGLPLTDDTWFATGEAVVSEVLKELDELNTASDGHVETSAVARYGDPGPVFADLSRDAQLIVLQHRDLSRLHRIVSGSTVTSVAQHAHCPVVSVPASAPSPRTAMVAVGVDQSGGPERVLEAAFMQASSRSSTLLVVHASRLPSAYEGALPGPIRWTEETGSAVTAALRPLQEKYGDVVVKTNVQYAWPADVLVETTRSADLLVLGRHSGLRGLPVRLGALARAAIAHGSCPIMIMPTDAGSDVHA